jgi:hypothetical protein
MQKKNKLKKTKGACSSPISMGQTSWAKMTYKAMLDSIQPYPLSITIFAF